MIFELAARRALDRPRGGVDGGGEHVDPHQRQVSGGLGGLLDQAHHSTDLTGGGRRELGDTVVLGIGHGREQDQRVWLVLAEGGHEV